MERKKIIAANWKMNLDINEAAEWLGDLTEAVEKTPCDVMVFPSFVMLGDLIDMYEGDKILFGAQNCSNKESGAYTGEVSARQLASIGVELVIVGHSERREYFHETNQMVYEKMQQAFLHELTPIFCCGEPGLERELGKHKEFVKNQLEESLFNFPAAALLETIIAYEPVWAIGTGVNATCEQTQEMHAYIRSLIAAKYSHNIAEQMPVLYGGSCKASNAKEIFNCSDVDGGLIGSASLRSIEFRSIIDALVVA
jgi:triosephosphate isomerase (TIM)